MLAPGRALSFCTDAHECGLRWRRCCQRRHSPAGHTKPVQGASLHFAWPAPTHVGPSSPPHCFQALPELATGVTATGASAHAGRLHLHQGCLRMQLLTKRKVTEHEQILTPLQIFQCTLSGWAMCASTTTGYEALGHLFSSAASRRRHSRSETPCSK